MLRLLCRETGLNCDYIIKGETEEDVMKNWEEHVKKAHGMKEQDLTPEMKQKIRGLIHSS